ncbi:hypothetical protein DFH09DRAFT_1179737 [Mycena vulgaris]|nr:hypothetical protein DFH09DRAFT_1196824 [Mycena vulgaris]KAJ6535225.1 hypothetical protein DFH09DRAFT_1179737 [Mycena vulgaris]
MAISIEANQPHDIEPSPFFPFLHPASLIGLAVSLALTFAIAMPFIGVLVRYRANYIPKRVRLDAEDGAVDETGSDISYFGMMKRVHRIEGWAGLYKGIMPSIINSLIAIVLFVPVVVFFAFVRPRTWIVYPTTALVISIVPVLLLVPMQIITNRAIITPHKLAAFAPSAALRVLLSPAERAQPLRLYLAPGVAFAQLLLAFIPVAVSMLRQLFVTRGHAHPWPVRSASLPALILITVLLTPVQVMLARLTLQRRVSASDGPIHIPVAADAVASPPTYGAEDVIEVRTQPEHAPYTSLLDCARTIVREEGRGSLFRAWWITALFTVLPVLFAPGVPGAPGAPPGRLFGLL